jgi:hypothetical protein
MESRTGTVEDHLAGQPAGSVALYRRMAERGWVREAYAVGQGAHLSPTRGLAST